MTGQEQDDPSQRPARPESVSGALRASAEGEDVYNRLGGGGQFVHDRSDPPVAGNWLVQDEEEVSSPAEEPERKPRRWFTRTDRSAPPPA